jgi:hypothetical protein
MGVKAQEKKYFNGMSAANSRKKLIEIFSASAPTADLRALSREFHVKYGLSLFALCETWHRLRAHSKPLEMIAHSFAETTVRRNREKTKLCETIHKQRLRLAELEALIARRTELAGRARATEV